jgi:CheY-like chemotaxis protein
MHPERRAHERARVQANFVLLMDGQCFGPYAARDLSAGGAMLDGRPPLEVGDGVEAVVELSPGKEVRLAAVVMRAFESSVALAFLDVAPDVEDAIQTLVLASLEAAHAATVLIVDDSPEVRRALARALRRLGHETRAVGSAAAALELLSGPNHFSVAFVDQDLGGEYGSDLLHHLALNHPDVRRVLMSGAVRTAQLALALASGQQALAHEVLAKPWSNETLARALDGAPRSSLSDASATP